MSEASDRLIDDLDLVRSLVRSWGELGEGSVVQATAIRNSRTVLANLVTSANLVAMSETGS